MAHLAISTRLQVVVLRYALMLTGLEMNKYASKETLSSPLVAGGPRALFPVSVREPRSAPS